jgi:hypothetical protein
MHKLYEASVRRILKSEAATHQGAYLEDVRFQHDLRSSLVVAVYRTPVPFTPQEVGAIEPKLPLRPGEQRLQLHIRSIPVTVASKDGYFYSSEGLAEAARAGSR